MKLRKEMESMNQIVKEAGNYKKKYNTAVE